MIDYDKPDDDPVVAEVRCIREQIASEYGYDLRAAFDAMQRQQATSGRRYATPRPSEAAQGVAESAKRAG